MVKLKIKKINGKLNIIGRNLKKYRELRGYTLRQFSLRLELFGLTMYHTDIYNIENGNKTVRDFEIKGFCKALNITLDNLYEDTDKYYE